MTKDSSTPVETASALNRELKARGLELRRGAGRDDALYSELCQQLGCSGTKLQAFLDQSSITAEEFLRAFLTITEPFARMYHDIWAYLAGAEATGAIKEDTVAVRFGHGSAASTTVNLERFRRHVHEYAQVRQAACGGGIRIRDIAKLFDVLKELDTNKVIQRGEGGQPYEFGKAFALPQLPPSAPLFMVRIRGFLQSTINDVAAAEVRNRQRGDVSQAQMSGTREEIAHAASLLHDLVPGWVDTFRDVGRLPPELIQRVDELVKTLFPVDPAESMSGRELVQRALDVLDLPFWKHRWHTYEIWMTVRTIRALEGFQHMTPVVLEGGLVLSHPKSGPVATFMDDVGGEHCLAAQVETGPEGKRIRPDLRACRGLIPGADSTMLIVESKQRAVLSAAHVQDVSKRYRGGSPDIVDLIICNYDDAAIAGSGSRVNDLIENCRPGQDQALHQFCRRCRMALKGAGVHPGRRLFVVMLDMSGSMRNKYKSEDAVRGLQLVREKEGIRVFGFNDGLIKNVEFESLASGSAMPPDAQTNLRKAIEDLQTSEGIPDAMLLITDGEFDESAHEGVPNLLQYSPVDIEQGLSALDAAIAAERAREID